MTSPTRVLRSRNFRFVALPNPGVQWTVAARADVTYQVNRAAVVIGVTMLVLPVKGQLHVFPDSPIASVLHHSSGEVWRLQRQRVFHLSVRGVCHEF